MQDIFTVARNISARQVAEAEGISLRERGRRWWACCPLHEDRKPSLMFDDAGRWHCFSCGLGGDGISFYAALHGVSQGEAARQLVELFALEGALAKPSPHAFMYSVRQWKAVELKRLCRLLAAAKAKAIASMEGVPRHAPFPDAFVRAVRAQTEAEALIAWLTEATTMEVYQLMKKGVVQAE